MLLQLCQPFLLFLPPPSPPSSLTVNHHTIVHVHGSCINVLWLIPSPSFNQSPPSLSPLTAVSLFHVSLPLVLFWSSVYFVHEIPLRSEIIYWKKKNSFFNETISYIYLPILHPCHHSPQIWPSLPCTAHYYRPVSAIASDPWQPEFPA